jgi:hypothetical protein
MRIRTLMFVAAAGLAITLSVPALAQNYDHNRWEYSDHHKDRQDWRRDHNWRDHERWRDEHARDERWRDHNGYWSNGRWYPNNAPNNPYYGNPNYGGGAPYYRP